MDKTRSLTALFASMIFVIIFSGCDSSTATPTGIPASPTNVFTEAAKTVFVDLTIQAGNTAAADQTLAAQLTNTATNLLPTSTPSFTPSPTLTPSPTATPTLTNTPTSTSTPIPPEPVICNRAQFVQDVTMPSRSQLPTSLYFKKIWRIRNSGNCTWDTTYMLTFYSGVVMTNDLDLPLPKSVSPGEFIDLAVDMYAPQQPGRYQNSWVLRDSYGQIFGVGSGGNQSFGVDIEAVIPPGMDPDRHLGLSYCDAAWTTGVGMIGCTQRIGDPLGFVALINTPQLETRTENELALWMHPDQDGNGRISGLYPSFTVMENEYFVAEIGCLAGRPRCDVTFSLGFLTQNNELITLASWREIQDANTNIVTVDLASLQGQRGQFTLNLINNGDPLQADGIWFMPQIINVSDT